MSLAELKLKIEAGLADEDWGAIKSALNDLEVIIENSPESMMAQIQKKPNRFIDELEKSSEPIHLWFGLTYAQYLTVPRLVMQSMPLIWQRKMAVLLREMDETFDWRPKEASYWVKLKDHAGRFVHAPLEDYRRGNCEHLRIIND